MKKALALAALVAFGAAAQAEIFTCQFTEPFYTVTYTTGTQVLRVVNNSENITKVYNGVGFLVDGPAKFELRQGTKVVMTLNLTGQGSDGMSDFNFPYEANFPTLKGYANGGVGGCESLKLKKAE